MLPCVDVYGMDPAVIHDRGECVDAWRILQFAQQQNPDLYWTLYGTEDNEDVFWYGTATPPGIGATDFPGAVSFPVNEDIYIYNGQMYDLTVYLNNECTD